MVNHKHDDVSTGYKQTQTDNMRGKAGGEKEERGVGEVKWDTTNEIQVAKSGIEEPEVGHVREKGVRIFSGFECEIISRTS